MRNYTKSPLARCYSSLLLVGSIVIPASLLLVLIMTADLIVSGTEESGDMMFRTGVNYLEGRRAPQDDSKAVSWFQKGAEQGDARAQNNLGFMYDKGRGVPQNYSEAAKW